MRKLVYFSMCLILMTMLAACNKEAKGQIAFADSNESGNTVNNILNGGFVTTQGDWLFYSKSPSEGGGIFAKNLKDSSEKELLKKDDARSLNVVGDWLYFANYSDQAALYKMKVDGSKKTKLSDDQASLVYVKNDWVYYLNEDQNLCRIQTNGSNPEMVLDSTVHSYFIDNEVIYYIDLKANRSIFKYDLATGKIETLLEEPAAQIQQGDHSVYFKKEDQSVYVMDVSIKQIDKVLAKADDEFFTHNGKLLYQVDNQMFALHLKDKKTASISKKETLFYYLQGANDTLYYFDTPNLETAHMQSMSLD